MQVSVLGAMELADEDTRIRLAGQGQRAVLAMLALAHGRMVPAERLIEAIWDGRPPQSARTKVQAHVSALRRAMTQPARAAGPLLTIGAGYALNAEVVQLDLALFDSLTGRAQTAAAAGQPAAAAALLGDGLALWRGPAFADVRCATVRGLAGALDERRLLAVEAKAEADLALGRCDVVAAELSAWLSLLPLRERLRGLAMLAHYRLGCRADALNLYRAGRRVMVAELGLEPGPQLRRLHQRILVDDEALRGPAHAAAPLGPGDTHPWADDVPARG